MNSPKDTHELIKIGNFSGRCSCGGIHISVPSRHYTREQAEEFINKNFTAHKERYQCQSHTATAE